MSVAFTPDDKTRWLRCSHDSDINLWDAATGKRIGTLRGHERRSAALLQSRRQRCLPTGSVDKTVRIWAWAEGKELLLLKGHTAEVNCVAFSPDGQESLYRHGRLGSRLCVSGTRQREQSKRALEGQQEFVRDLVYTSDGKTR